ncbi:hypothetical protein B0H13DRAFT_1882443 [Mycena leptocephala]|nr:hypothetical protein B0H13DRAFT_1882443 [Mycena leptocephala]
MTACLMSHPVASAEDVQRNCDTAKRIFESIGNGRRVEIEICDLALADLNLREGNFQPAKMIFEGCTKGNLGIHKALQFLGDIFLAQSDENTAVSLFTVALEGFNYMDVHRSRAECMLRLGDIAKGHNDLLKATELWETARPLFERSSQAKQVERIDERLTGIGEAVREEHRNNLARLAELNAPSGNIEGNDASSETEFEQESELL